MDILGRVLYESLSTDLLSSCSMAGTVLDSAATAVNGIDTEVCSRV